MRSPASTYVLLGVRRMHQDHIGVPAAGHPQRGAGAHRNDLDLDAALLLEARARAHRASPLSCVLVVVARMIDGFDCAFPCACVTSAIASAAKDQRSKCLRILTMIDLEQHSCLQVKRPAGLRITPGELVLVVQQVLEPDAEIERLRKCVRRVQVEQRVRTCLDVGEAVRPFVTQLRSTGWVLEGSMTRAEQRILLFVQQAWDEGEPIRSKTQAATKAGGKRQDNLDAWDGLLERKMLQVVIVNGGKAFRAA